MTHRRRAGLGTRGDAVSRTLALSVAVLLPLGIAGCGRDLPLAGTPASSTAASASGSGSATPSASGSAGTGAEPGAKPGTAQVIAEKLKAPVGVAFLPDGSALVGQRSGKVVLVGEGEPEAVGTVPGVSTRGEGGLLGLAVASPDGGDPAVFAYLTSTAGGNRVVRMSWADGKLGAPAVVLSGIASAGARNGGALILGPDGNLWVGTGDAGVPSRAQSRSSLNGKILRITAAGKPAKGNPFPGSPVWSSGHRDVRGLAFDSRNRLWSTDIGQGRWDELNRIVMGRNYGWPAAEGKAGRSGYVDPARQWRPAEAGPGGMVIVGDVAYISTSAGRRIWSVPLAEKTAGKPTALAKDAYGPLRNVALSPDRTLWVTTSAKSGEDKVLAFRLP